MRTQYYTASSLDGFIATTDHSLEWLFQFGDVKETSYSSFIAEVGALAMGSSTYEWMLRHIVQPETADAGPRPTAAASANRVSTAATSLGAATGDRIRRAALRSAATRLEEHGIARVTR